MSNYEIELEPKQILAAIHEHLTNVFFRAPKTEAKKVFTEISNGGQTPFLEISSANKGDVVGVLALDHSEYVGKLNFSAFRDIVGAHLQRIGEKLNNEENLNIFTNEQTGDILFNIPGILERDQVVNILVTGIEQRSAGQLTVKMMFLDPANFVEPVAVN